MYIFHGDDYYCEVVLYSVAQADSFSRDVHMLGRWAVDRDLGAGGLEGGGRDGRKRKTRCTVAPVTRN